MMKVCFAAPSIHCSSFFSFLHLYSCFFFKPNTCKQLPVSGLFVSVSDNLTFKSSNYPFEQFQALISPVSLGSGSEIPPDRNEIMHELYFPLYEKIWG